jgi:hypothetical protein
MWKEQKRNPILARTVTILGLMVVNDSHQEGVLEGFGEQGKKYWGRAAAGWLEMKGY